MIYDDGSELIENADGSIVALNTDGQYVSGVRSDGGYFRSPMYETDAREQIKLAPFYGAQQKGSLAQLWYEQAAMYGITRAIDSHFGPPATNKSTEAASYAGTNGKTYRAGQQGQAQPGGGGMDTTMLLVLGAIAFAVLG